MEDLLKSLGGCGRYQLVLLILLGVNLFPVAVNHFVSNLNKKIGYQNENIVRYQYCKDDYVYDTRTNYSSAIPFNRTLPCCEHDGYNCESMMSPNFQINELENASFVCRDKITSTTTFDEIFSTNILKTSCRHCQNLKNQTKYALTIKTENLMCDGRVYWLNVIETVYICGVGIGGVIMGTLVDRFGRKILLNICLYTQCVVSIIIYFTRPLWLIILLRFILGLFLQGLFISTLCLVIELFPIRHRGWSVFSAQGMVALGTVVFALMSKFVRPWRYLQLTLNIPTVISILYLWLLPESLRWLLSKGKISQAESVAMNIISYNNNSVNISELRFKIEQVSKKILLLDNLKTGYGFHTVFTHQRIRRNTLLLLIIWLSLPLCQVSIMPNLSDDVHIDAILYGFIQMGSLTLALILITRIGRTSSLVCYLIFCTVFNISAAVLIPFTNGLLNLRFSLLPMLMCMFGLIASKGALYTTTIVTLETYPTPIRATGLGFCLFCYAVGQIFETKIFVLLQNYSLMSKTATSLVPVMAFSGISLIAALMAFLLPKTSNKDLPDSLPENSIDYYTGISRSRIRETGSMSSRLEVSNSQIPVRHESFQCYGKTPQWIKVNGMIVSTASDVKHVSNDNEEKLFGIEHEFKCSSSQNSTNLSFMKENSSTSESASETISSTDDTGHIYLWPSTHNGGIEIDNLNRSGDDIASDISAPFDGINPIYESIMDPKSRHWKSKHKNFDVISSTLDGVSLSEINRCFHNLSSEQEHKKMEFLIRKAILLEEAEETRL